jgi:hypothetical protein
MGVSVDLPPTRIDVYDGGGESDWVELFTARNDIDAHLLVGRLDEAGIQSHTVKDRSAPGAWLYGGSNPWAPVAVFVRRLQLEDARLVLAEISMRTPFVRPIPERSSRRGTLVWWAVALVLGAFFTWVGLERMQEEMRDCRPPACRLDVGP